MVCSELENGFYFASQVGLDSPKNIRPCPCADCQNKFTSSFATNFAYFLLYSFLSFEQISSLITSFPWPCTVGLWKCLRFVERVVRSAFTTSIKQQWRPQTCLCARSVPLTSHFPCFQMSVSLVLTGVRSVSHSFPQSNV